MELMREKIDDLERKLSRKKAKLKEMDFENTFYH